MRLAPSICVALVAGCARPPIAPTPTAAPIAPPARDDGPVPTAPDALPDAVRPLAYRLDLTVDPTAIDYHGAVEIDLALASAQPALWWHATTDLRMTAVTVRRGDAPVPVRALVPTPVGGEIAGAALATPLAAGPATVRIEFTGPLRDLTGVFRNYTDDGPFVFTDLEPTDARSAFPCLDELRWRAPVTLTLTTPERFAAYANMPERTATREGDWVVRQFEPTPPLPTYLIAFAVGEFAVVSVPDAPIPTRILAPPALADVAHARAQLGPLLTASSGFLGRPWPWPKLDVVVVPDLRGAMENPGLITIAADIAHHAVTESGRAHVERVLAHELAHIWFGTWITPASWSELWLSEGLATWMSDRVTRAARRLRTDSARIVERQAAYALDELGARALRPAAVATARELFDELTYHKGAAVMSALESWLGSATVADGLNRYLDAHPWGTATTDDLARALAAAAQDQPVASALAAAVSSPGLPTVTVTRTCAGPDARLELRASGPGRPTPVCVRWGGPTGGRSCALVDTDVTIAIGPRCPPWYVVEPDTYARWSLGRSDWAPLATAPLGPDAQLAALDAALVALADGRADVDAVIATAEAALASGDRNAGPAAISALRLVADAAGPSRRAEVHAAVAAATTRALARLDRDPADDQRLRAPLRTHALALLGAYGRDRRQARSAARVVATWARGGAVSSSTLGPALVTVAAQGTARQRAQLRAAAFRDRPATHSAAMWLARALVHEPDAVALATGTVHVPIGPVRRALQVVLLTHPRLAAPLVAALTDDDAELLRALRPIGCAELPALSSALDDDAPMRTVETARCRAIAARLAR